MKSLPEIGFKKSQTNKYGIEVIYFDQLSKLNPPNDHNPFAPHRLKFNALLIIGDGKGGNHNIDFKNYQFHKNTVLLVAKEQVHNFIDLPSSNIGMLILFEEDIFLEISGSINLLVDYLYNYEIFEPKIDLSEEEFDELKGLVDNLKDELVKNYSNIHKEIAKAWLKIILLNLYKKRKIKKQFENNLTSDFIIFKKLLKKHIVEQKKVQYYAKAMNITPQKLNKITNDVINKSAKTYIVETIILEAKRYLKSSRLTSKEIAYQLGFDEPTNFTKFFKKHTTMLPSEFANRPL